MTIFRRSQGATPTGTSNGVGTTSVTPSLPAGITDGDVVLIFVATKYSGTQTINTPANWTQQKLLSNVGGGTTGVDAGPVSLAVFSRVKDGSWSTMPAVSITNGASSYAQAFCYQSDGATDWSLAAAGGSDSTTGTAWSATMDGDPGLAVNDLIFVASAIPTDITTPAQFTLEGITGTGLDAVTCTELSEPETTTGNDMGGFVFESRVAVGASSAAPTVVATASGTTTNVRGGSIMVRLRVSASATTVPRRIGGGVPGINASAATTLNVPYPASGITAGDLLLLYVSPQSTTLPTTPSGWTLVAEADANALSPSGRVWWKIATGSESGNQAVTTPNVTSQGLIEQWRYCGDAPVDVTGLYEDSVGVANYVMPSVDAVYAGDVLIDFLTSNSAVGFWTPPAGAFAKVREFSGTSTHLVGHKSLTAAGATGADTWVRSGAVRGFGIRVAIRNTMHAGVGNGTIGWAGSAAGARASSGVATGAIGWAGEATGEMPVSVPNTGSATGTITWNGQSVLTADQASVETSLGDWQFSTVLGAYDMGSAVARSTAQAHEGTQSVLATWSTTALGNWVGTNVLGLTPGQKYEFSAWVYVPTGSPDVRVEVPFLGASAYTSVKDTWVKLTKIYTAGSTENFVGVQCGPATLGQTCYIDDLVVNGTVGSRTPKADGTGAVEWVGSATGLTQHPGAATGAIGWAGSATGKRFENGAAIGTIGWAGSATGTKTPKGVANGTIGWAGSTRGLAPGNAAGAISWVGSATGLTQHRGASTGAIGWVGSSTGLKPVHGAATGAVGWVGSATGSQPKRGAASGAIGWAGSATGVKIPKGAGAGAITWVGSATGVRRPQGAATGAIGWVGSATGTRTPKGVGVGTIGWVGSATGSKPVHGAGTGTIGWVGSATGARESRAAATGAVGWVGSATGSKPVNGSSSGAVAWAGSATGARVAAGVATGSIGWVGSATGVKVPIGAAVGTISWEGLATGGGGGAVTGTISWSGSSTGTKHQTGTATGDISWAGSATGSKYQSGSAAGTLSWSGTAEGIRHPVGDATGAIGWAGLAEGVNGAGGTATGAIGWAGVATGARQSSASATGAVSWAGEATGARSSVGQVTGTVVLAGTATGVFSPQGEASGQIAWTGNAQGFSLGGTAYGDLTWEGVATGITERIGQALGTVTWSGAATGKREVLGLVHGGLAWTGTSSGVRSPVGVASGELGWSGLVIGAGRATLEVVMVGPPTYRVGPGGTVEIQFQFTALASQWVVRLDSTGPYDGTEIVSGSGDRMRSATAIIPASLLVPGENRMKVYAKAMVGAGWF